MDYMVKLDDQLARKSPTRSAANVSSRPPPQPNHSGYLAFPSREPKVAREVAAIK
jgi:hypothetical protein